MRCAYHPDTEAIGICKNCCKGLCPACAADLGNGIACQARCESEVQAASQLMQKSKTVLRKSSQIYVGLSVGLGALALILLALVSLFSGSDEAPMRYFLGGAAIVLLGGCVLLYRWARKLDRPEP